MLDLKKLMQEVLAAKSPDLHLQVGQYPIVRLKNGSITSLDEYSAMTKEEVKAVINAITTDLQKEQFKKNLEFDFSHHVEGFGRFRVNIYFEKNGPAIAFRVISDKVPTLEELSLGSSVEKLLHLPHGLVLVTGPTGMGKTTTLASMIDYLNKNRNAHIITIEDPIEYVYQSRHSLITQREVNVHTHSFSNAIRAALRQDPDIVLVGEMRDLETIDRIIDVFPAYQQEQVKTQLGNTLKGVISQVLVPRADGEGRVAAREIMIANDAIRNCIVQGQVHQMYSMIQIGASEGMVLMDQALEQLVNEGKITREDALSKAKDIEALAVQLNNANAEAAQIDE